MQGEKKPYSLLEEEYNTIRRKHLALIVEMQKLEQEVFKHREYSEFAKKQLINADENVAIQKNITMNNIMQSQETHDNLVAEILELRADIKQLKG